MALIGGKPSLSNDEAVRKLAESRRVQSAREVDVESRRARSRWRRGIGPTQAVRDASQMERDELREILVLYGFEHSAADVEGLQRDGMGPEELRQRARRRDDNIGYWAANAHFKTLRRT